MAVKPITNKQVVSTQGINRAEQRSTRNTTSRSGNRSTSITPGKDLTKNYAITLKDVDTAILSHVKDVMNPSLKEANEIIKEILCIGDTLCGYILIIDSHKVRRNAGFHVSNEPCGSILN